MLYVHYKLEAANELSRSSKESVLNYLGGERYNKNRKSLEEEIGNTLESGYENNNEQKMLKDLYIRDLNTACIFTNVIIEGFAMSKDKEVNIVDVFQQKYQDYINKGKNGTMSHIVDTLAADRQFLDVAKQRISEMFETSRYTKTQRKYLRDVMFTAWLERGQKLRKNDIFDMFCLGCLDYENTREKNE